MGPRYITNKKKLHTNYMPKELPSRLTASSYPHVAHVDLVKWEILKLVESLAIDYYFLVPVVSRQTTIDGHKTDFLVS